MKTALVCDFLTKWGGAENVLLSLTKAFPDAPIYCLLYDEKGTRGKFSDKKIISSSLQKLPSFIRRHTKYFINKYPSAIEEFDFSNYDVVVSSSNSFAHGIITKPSTLHVCYCHSPMRYAWDWTNEYLAENNIGFDLKGLYVRKTIHDLRIWDKAAADRADFYVANSTNVQKRIKKYYGLNSSVIYPSVDVKHIGLSEKKAEDFYLIISRLEPYKQIRLAVETFNENHKKLKIIGEGSQEKILRKIAKDNIEFLGWQDDEQKYKILSDCKAFIFPGEDDFGITPVEAMAAGRPVIAYNKGGVTETVIVDETGVFFDEPSTKSLNSAINKLEDLYDNFIPAKCRDRAEHFSEEAFIIGMQEFVREKYKHFLSSRS